MTKTVKTSSEYCLNERSLIKKGGMVVKGRGER